VVHVLLGKGLGTAGYLGCCVVKEVYWRAFVSVRGAEDSLDDPQPHSDWAEKVVNCTLLCACFAFLVVFLVFESDGDVVGFVC
jgi:hypothetical protein